MKLIVGLGNPGEKYINTRHNLGFMAIDRILEEFESAEKTFWDEKRDLKSNIKYLKSKDLMLAKPVTFMNDSGSAVSKIINYYKIDPQDLTVIHDDLDLPFGKIRVRFGGGAGGHHGVESIIDTIKTDRFLRVRLGIGSLRKVQSSRLVGGRAKFKVQSSKNVEDYVLGTVASNERGKVKTMIGEAVRTTKLILEHGIEKYMGKYNS